MLGNPNQWFNPNAFLLPTAGTYGNVGRGIYRARLADLDMSLFKNIAVTERMVAIPGGILQRAESREFRHAECHRLFERRPQFLGGIDHDTSTTSRQIQFGLKLIF